MKGLTLASAALGKNFAMCDEYANIVEAYVSNALNGRQPFTGLDKMAHLAEAEHNIQGFTRMGSTGTFRVQFDPNTGIAVVPIVGMIVPKASSIGMSMQGTSMELLQNRLFELRANDDVKGVILRVHSGGGSVLGVPEAAQAIRDLAKVKPVHASIDMFAASAAYWLASAADKIYISESGIAGSIGVFAILANQAAKLKKDGIEVRVVRRGAFKHRPNTIEGFEGEEMEASIAKVDAGVDRVYNAFISAISTNLNITMSEAKELATGEVFDGKEALEKGLATEEGTFRDAASGMVLELNATKEDEPVVEAAAEEVIEATEAPTEPVAEEVVPEPVAEAAPVAEEAPVTEATEETDAISAENQIALLKAQNELLAANAAKAEKDAESAKISAMIATAVEDGRIPVQKEAQMTALATQVGFSAFNEMLSAIPVPAKIDDLSTPVEAKDDNAFVAEELRDGNEPKTELAARMYAMSPALSKRYNLK